MNQFITSNIFNRAFKIFESSSRTELEEAIARGIYWYSDAHRDTISVMKLIKYWSCIETFFSFENKDITNSVSAGLASVLVYGGFEFAEVDEYINLKKKISKLYNMRSRAVHGGSYNHVSEINIAEISQWTAWMLINMISLTERGYTQTSQIKIKTDQLDNQHNTLKKKAEETTHTSQDV